VWSQDIIDIPVGVLPILGEGTKPDLQIGGLLARNAAQLKINGGGLRAGSS